MLLRAFRTIMGTDFSLLKSKKILVLDMDGTIYLGDRLIDGALDFIIRLKDNKKDFLLFTNNSSKTSEFYIKKLSRMGCHVSANNIMTSGDVTINYLKRKHNISKVYLVGTEILEESFRKSGIHLVDDNPEIVVIGFDTTLTYEKLSKACKFIRNGALFLATHLDLNCPVENGFIPDCGAMCALIQASTGIKPTYLGKPYKETLDAIKETTGYNEEDIVFIGDRLYTDIAIGANHGVTTILVLSGETSMDDVEKSDIKPDFILSSLGDLLEVI